MGSSCTFIYIFTKKADAILVIQFTENTENTCWVALPIFQAIYK